jgi:DNA polymerase V
MSDLLVLDMVEKGIATNQITLTVGYEAMESGSACESYRGELSLDYYGRVVPKYAHGTVNFLQFTSSSSEIVNNTLQLYDKIVDKRLLVRRINICASNVKSEEAHGRKASFEQLDMFTDYDEKKEQRRKYEAAYNKEKRAQKAVIDIKRRYGKNAILKGMNFEEGATTIDRNLQIGGHKA